VKPRGGEGQNGRLKCPMGFLVSKCFHAPSKTLYKEKEFLQKIGENRKQAKK